MLQRVQTLYLIGSIVLFILMLCFPIGYLSIGKVTAPLNVFGFQIGQVHHSTLIIAIVSFISLICQIAIILLFNNRLLQLRLVIFNIVLQVAFYIAVIASVMIYSDDAVSSFSVGWAIFIPVVTIVLNVLAYRAIRKDEALVRSLNHLR
jgi:hypothetical protein